MDYLGEQDFDNHALEPTNMSIEMFMFLWKYPFYREKGVAPKLFTSRVVSALDSSSDVTDQQSVGSSPCGLDTCVLKLDT